MPAPLKLRSMGGGSASSASAPEMAVVASVRQFLRSGLRRSVVMEARNRVVLEEELGERRDGEVDLTPPRGPDEALLDEAVAMR